MDVVHFIQLILPLRLEWEPWYSSTEELSVGQRVKVALAGRSYTAVVSRTGACPDIPASRIRPIGSVESQLEPITENEIRFWRFLADYYMCTVGEIYKIAYPSTYSETERKRANKGLERNQLPSKHLSALDKLLLCRILEGFGQRQPVLLRESAPSVLAELERRAMEDGRDVLRLSPSDTKPGYVQMRELARTLRSSDEAALVQCGKSGLFLPYKKLGLVIIEEEHSSAYKQKNAPLYNVRDAAVALASIHGADVLLVSSLPSLETMFNVLTGKYLSVGESLAPVEEVEMIGTEDEFRKNGMVGTFSRRLLLRMGEVLDHGGRVLLLLPWKDTREIEIEARTHFPKARTKLKVSALASGEDYSRYDLVALLKADYMLSRNDFRADEKTYRAYSELCASLGGRLLVQTRETSHPAFRNDPGQLERLLMERKEYNFPPFSRMVDIELRDSNDARRVKMELELSKLFGGLRILLPKDRTLSEKKVEIKKIVAGFEKEFHYTGHIIINVDPL